MADQWLRTGKRPEHQTVIEDGYTFEVNDEMLSYIEQYVDWVRECDGEHFYERKVDFSSIMPIPNQTGTSDHFAAAPGKLTITDLKFGKGIKVFAEENPQGLLYALGVFFEWDWYYGFEEIIIRICQPRLDHFDVWVIDRQQLLAFADYIRDRAALAWRLDAPRTPGEKQCQWCKVKADCPAYLNWFEGLADERADAVFPVAQMAEVAAQAGDMFGDYQIPLPELSVEAWARILPMRRAVEAWFAAGEDKLFAAALEGAAPGWKIVDGRSTRAWVDEEAAKDRMIEVGIPADETENRKLKSPNQAEEYLHAQTRMPKKKASELFESFTERQQGVRSLVRSADKREALPSYGDVFDEDI